MGSVICAISISSTTLAIKIVSLCFQQIFCYPQPSSSELFLMTYCFKHILPINCHICCITFIKTTLWLLQNRNLVNTFCWIWIQWCVFHVLNGIKSPAVCNGLPKRRARPRRFRVFNDQTVLTCGLIYADSRCNYGSLLRLAIARPLATR